MTCNGLFLNCSDWSVLVNQFKVQLGKHSMHRRLQWVNNSLHNGLLDYVNCRRWNLVVTRRGIVKFVQVNWLRINTSTLFNWISPVAVRSQFFMLTLINGWIMKKNNLASTCSDTWVHQHSRTMMFLIHWFWTDL